MSQDSPKPTQHQQSFLYHNQQQQQQQTDQHVIEANRAKEQEELRQSSQQLDNLSMMWPGEGKEGRWLVDINLLFNGVHHEENSNTSIVTQQQQQPVININSNLISLFFRHRYSAFPILPKSIFYRLLEHRDPIINPLLLNSMYCNAAHFSHEEASEADNYYKKAQVLLDDYIDTPSLGTIVSLCLVSTFESNRYSRGPHAKTNRSRMYSDMAFRMCYDLKLHKRYLGQVTTSTPDDNELRKRVYWTCYCLDKISSLINGRPYLLYSKDIDIDFPMVLESFEYDVNSCFVEHIKLMQICERVLQLNNTIGGGSFHDGGMVQQRSPENEQLVLDLDQQLLYWLRNLPQQFQWTPLDTTDVPTQPPVNALVAHLHLVYNYAEITVLQPLASATLSSSPASLLIQQRCASVATNLTQLTCAMADQPNFIMSFTFASEAIMAAVRVHIMDCADEKLNTARHARFMFQRSLRSLKCILHHRVIDRIQEFTTTIERALADADDGNSNSRNSSPKLHVLSPVIPRTSPNNSTLEDRWTRLNNTANAAATATNAGIYNYGLISPASSTTSAAPGAPTVANATTSMNVNDKAGGKATHLVYNNSASTTSMDPYSRTSASFTNSIPPSSTPNSWRSPVLSSSQQITSTTIMKNQHHHQQQQEQQQQQMEMYSNIWSGRTTTTTAPEQAIFSLPTNNNNSHHHHHLDNSFLTTAATNNNTTRQDNNNTMKDNTYNQQNTTTNTASSTVTLNADAEIYSLWDDTNNNVKKEQQATQQEQPILFTPQGRYGLGVYASAQQHHTDVIRQHMPGASLKSTSHRPVLLNHYGQVVVAPENNTNNSSSAATTTATIN